MDIDRDQLPEDPAALRLMVAGLLEELDSRGRRLQQLQHLVEQLLRWRYGPKRERVTTKNHSGRSPDPSGSGFGVELGAVNTNSVFLSGTVDDVRVYNSALSASEVWDLYLGTGGT